MNHTVNQLLTKRRLRRRDPARQVGAVLYLEQQRMKRQEIAAAIGVRPSTLSHLTGQRGTPLGDRSARALFQLARRFGWSPNEDQR